MVKETNNIYGHRIETVGDISLNLEYWDCECTGRKYIHSISENECEVCMSIQDECPSSREDEVLLFICNDDEIIMG